MLIKEAEGEIVLNDNNCIGVRKLIRKETEFVSLKIKAGSKLDSHSLPIDVTFYVVKGSGIVTVNGIKTDVENGDIVTVGSDKQRCWDNNSSEELSLLVIKHL